MMVVMGGGFNDFGRGSVCLGELGCSALDPFWVVSELSWWPVISFDNGLRVIFGWFFDC